MLVQCAYLQGPHGFEDESPNSIYLLSVCVKENQTSFIPLKNKNSEI